MAEPIEKEAQEQEKKLSEQNPSERKPSEKRPSERTPSERRPSERKSSERKSSERKSSERSRAGADRKSSASRTEAGQRSRTASGAAKKRNSSAAAGRQDAAAAKKRSSGAGSRSGVSAAKNRSTVPEISVQRNSNLIDGLTFGISGALLLAAFAGALYTGTGGTLLKDFVRIITTPSPTVTDYFGLGSLPATFLNAGLCGLSMACFMFFLPGPSHVNTLSGYFLVIAHCFYGLNFLNMWPCFLAPFLYMWAKGLDLNENLHVNMFSTCFSPFISELLFRYTQGENYVAGKVTPTFRGLLLTLLFTLIIAVVAPAVLPGVKAWHKGYNLYNGGLAYGMLGFLFFSFLYRTMGVEAPTIASTENAVYESFGRSYHHFGNIFFLLLFGICLFAGWYFNGKSLNGIGHLFRDTGYQSNFAQKYGMPLCLINIGLYGALFLAYVNLAVIFTEGAGFTGPTFGVIFAALTFTAMGQHVRNVWPIFLGYPLLSLVCFIFNNLIGGSAYWTISTQGYINSVAFATGLCPIVGRYGNVAGIAAGMLCAALCTSTGALHGGLILYNGGFTAGITALILLPILENYVKHPRESMDQHIDLRDMITVDNTQVRPTLSEIRKTRRGKKSSGKSSEK